MPATLTTEIRRPWAAAAIALLFTPALGAFYVGRALCAIAYLLLAAWVFALPSLAAHFGFLPISPVIAIATLWIVYGTLGAAHCFYLANRSVAPGSDDRFLFLYGLLALPLFVAFLPKLLWEPYHIPARSMEPSLQMGDYFFASKFAYDFREPQRGELVVFLTPDERRTAYVKRLLGLPGDRIQMRGGVLYLNDALVPRKPQVSQAESRPRLGQIYRESLPNGHSHLIQEMSDTSPFDDTAVYEVPPGHYFFLGDNRDNSIDSRNMIGNVPRENLIGPLTVVVWNMETLSPRLFDPDW